MFSDIVFRWLDVALDYGISEHDFWEMTIAELERAINSKKRVQKREAQERASFDYILADLVGRSISRIYNSTNNIPSISEVYPTLFDSKEYEEAKSVKQDELSALRFRQFAQSFNKRFKGVSNKDE
jgi:hypothetical protein